MFGTLARLQLKPGMEQAFLEMNERWRRERAPRVAGVGDAFMLLPAAGGDLWLLATFDNREDYYNNADDPAQDRWYQEMRSMLQADPEWIDGEIVKL